MSRVKIGVWNPKSIDVDRFDNVDSLESLCDLLEGYPQGTYIELYLNKETDKIAFKRIVDLTIGTLSEAAVSQGFVCLKPAVSHEYDDL